ncbi:hypothetical protein PDJAM_G00030320 [Pangasius djambal]|uniref:Uncharacterized protein n=1 Tax=Pangasius djambal TaxID=1691987 RepID=A0ACC5YR16_9TELE|nr:hypothetical protein [Pangasius djambal]
MDDKETSSLSNSKEINKTYIISSLSSRCDEAPSAGRLTLQRRNTHSRNTLGDGQEASENTENQSHGKRLTLQRRTRAGAGCTAKASHPHTSSLTEKRAWTCSKILSEPNSRTAPAPAPLPLRSASLRDVIKPGNTPAKTTEKAQKTFSTPTGKTQFDRISLKKEVFEKLSAKDQPKLLTPKQTGVERQKQSSTDPNGGAIPGSANKKFPIISQNRSTISTGRKNTTQLSSGLNAKSKPPPSETRVSVESGGQTAALPAKELKMENSAVTVAVRVRPFSHREKNENAGQVVFMENHETVVQHPDTKQTYTFSFDFSFYSAEEMDPDFASQQTIYEKLARPLLERAFEGFNTCLFAYGQTGSGKSYTMMGFGEEAGVIPRFCEELFTRVSRADKNEASSLHSTFSAHIHLISRTGLIN